jgi:hypothetical protein
MQRIPHPPETGFTLERVFFGHEIPLPEPIEDAKYRSEKGKMVDQRSGILGALEENRLLHNCRKSATDRDCGKT